MSSAFDTTKTQLENLLRDIVQGKTQLPDFQRGWVWDDEHIRSLLVSIARSFPVGAIMLLEAGGDVKFKVRPVEGVRASDAPPEKAEKLILDGQQRLTSLTQVLMLKQPVETHDGKKKRMKRHYYINIEKALEGPKHYEEAIIGVDEGRMLRENFGRNIKLDLSTPEKEYAEFYFPCDQILDDDEWVEGLNEYQPEKLSRYLQFKKIIVKAFLNYHLPVIELKKENQKEAVCLVFEKVNTGGVPLSIFELMTATYAADGANLRDEWFGNRKDQIKGIHNELKSSDLLRDVQPTDFLQGLTLLHTYQRRKEDIAAGRSGKQITGVSAKRETVLSLPLHAYQEWKEQLVEGFKSAAAFLREESFYSRIDLPYQTQLVPLAAVMTLLEKRQWREPRVKEKLARWYWCGVLGELYGSAVETRFALDVQELMEWINGDGEEPSTIRDANFQDTRLGTLQTRNSAAYKGIHVLMQREQARDFFWKTTINELRESEDDQIDIHHIFPRRWCEEKRIPSIVYNSILNKTPISSKANRMIGGRAPREYLHQLQSHKNVQIDDAAMDEILRTHAINPAFLRIDDFEGFIADRRKQMIEKIAEAMGKSVSISDTPDQDIYSELEGEVEV